MNSKKRAIAYLKENLLGSTGENWEALADAFDEHAKEQRERCAKAALSASDNITASNLCLEAVEGYSTEYLAEMERQHG